MLETQRLAEDGDTRGAWGNALISLAAGLAAAAIGRLIGRHL
jgi:fluoride ion exporter CrcB/FEX